jgi:hypothetical protein
MERRRTVNAALKEEQLRSPDRRRRVYEAPGWKKITRLLENEGMRIHVGEEDETSGLGRGSIDIPFETQRSGEEE